METRDCSVEGKSGRLLDNPGNSDSPNRQENPDRLSGRLSDRRGISSPPGCPAIMRAGFALMLRSVLGLAGLAGPPGLAGCEEKLVQTPDLAPVGGIDCQETDAGRKRSPALYGDDEETCRLLHTLDLKDQQRFAELENLFRDPLISTGNASQKCYGLFRARDQLVHPYGLKCSFTISQAREDERRIFHCGQKQKAR